MSDPAVAAEIKEAAAKAAIKIHGVMNADHWRYPLSSADPEVVNKSVVGMETSLRNAKLWGADAVLLVPGVVNADTGYKDAWTRSQKVVKERILPLAQELKVVIGMEEVWNKFLISPLEMARYVDEFNSPWVKAYLDVGNMLFYGFPQDWIRTLGPRICRVHVKDFKLDRKESKYLLDESRRGRRRLARGPGGAGRGEVRGLGDDRDQRRRRGLPERRRGAPRSDLRRAEADRASGLGSWARRLCRDSGLGIRDSGDGVKLPPSPEPRAPSPEPEPRAPSPERQSAASTSFISHFVPSMPSIGPFSHSRAIVPL